MIQSNQETLRMKQSNKIISMTALVLLLASLTFTSTSALAEVDTDGALTVAALGMDKAIIRNDADKKKKGTDEEEPDCE